MKNSFLFSILTLFCFNLNQANAQNITSTFDIDDEDWLVVGDATSSTPQYHSEGGNDGGYISADDTAAGGVWYWSAPSKFLGNQSVSYGRNLSFDLAQDNLSSQFDADDILIISDMLTIALDLPNNPEIDWTSYLVKLDTSENWMVTTYLSGIVATEEQIQAVLSNILEIRIRGEYVSGADVGSLDNVILETESMNVSEVLSSKMKVFPNPTKGELFLSENANEISVYNLNGQKLKVLINTKPLNISEFPAGIYIIRGIDSEGKLFQTKLIKK